MKNQNPAPKILKTFKPFVEKKLSGVIKDIQLVRGQKFKKSLFKNYFEPFNFLQGTSIKLEKRLSVLTSKWKYNWRKYVQSKHLFFNLITLIDAKTQKPVNSSDKLYNNELPTFEEQERHQYKPLAETELSEELLSPSTQKLKPISAKMVADLLGIVNRLAHDYFSKAEKHLLRFRKYSDTLPKVTSNAENRPEPTELNVLGYITKKWEIVLYVSYLATLLSEMMVFFTIGLSTLHLEKYKAVVFSLVISGISYLIALFFFRYVLKFLRSKVYTPKLLKVFLGFVLVYVLASGFLSFNAGQERKLENRFILETNSLGSLELLQFSDPNYPNLQAEINKQRQIVNNLNQRLSSPSLVKSIISGILYILMSFISLFASGLILSLALCVSQTNFHKRQMKRSEKILASIESEYEWRSSVFKKYRTLVATYIFESGRRQAIKSLLVSPPTPEELGANFTEKTKTTPKRNQPTVNDLEVEDPEEIISSEMYDKSYNNN